MLIMAFLKRATERFRGLFNKRSGIHGLSLDSYSRNNLQEIVYYKELVLQSIISLIANTLSTAPLTNYKNGEEEKNELYYLFNVSPNSNQNIYEFWHELITKLIYKNEVLIIENNGELLIADEFERRKFVTYENKYFNVVVDDFRFPHAFLESEVYYLTLHNKKLSSVINGLYRDYSVLIESSITGFKRSNGLRGTVKVNASISQQKEAQEALDELIYDKFGKYHREADGIVTLLEGFDYKDYSTLGAIDSRDVKNLLDDFLEMISTALHIPIGLLKGDTVATKEQIDSLLMLCINPIAKLITSEINRKNYGSEVINSGNYVKLDTQRIKHVDLKELAGACDLLFRIGVNSINDNLRLLDREPVNEVYADDRHVTKNYIAVKDIGKDSDNNIGGGKDAKRNGKEGN